MGPGLRGEVPVDVGGDDPLVGKPVDGFPVAVPVAVGGDALKLFERIFQKGGG